MIISGKELAQVTEDNPDTIVKVTRTLVYVGKAKNVTKTLEMSQIKPREPFQPQTFLTITEPGRVIELP